MRRRVSGVVAVAAVAAVVAGCGSSGGGASTSTSSVPSTASGPSVSPSGPSSVGASGSGGAASASASTGKYYVSIGDSYAAGYQPTAPGKGSTTRNGFAYQVVTGAKAKGYQLTLVNFACAGATTSSVLTKPGCAADLRGPGGEAYTDTQAAAAEKFLRAHRGDVALVTVSLGGNDVTACGVSSNPVGCVTTALATVEKNLATLLSGLRSAAGPSTRIIGTTYPDVLLGDTLSKDAARRSTAALSVVAFKSLINPGLLKTYKAANAGFVDVTAATGAYGSMTQKTTLAPYGSIPVPVAKICTLTYYCQYQDIHPRTNGYAVIAKLILADLPAK